MEFEKLLNTVDIGRFKIIVDFETFSELFDDIIFLKQTENRNTF